MSKKFFNSYIPADFEGIYENKKLSTMNEKRREKEKEKEEKNHKFILESRYQLMQESLNKSKIGTDEFNALLDECIAMYLELNEITNIDKDAIKKIATDEILTKNVVEFDGKKVENTIIGDRDWPACGRITLREAIPKKYLGQNSKVKNSENVEKIFGASANEQPSPSNSKI